MEAIANALTVMCLATLGCIGLLFGIPLMTVIVLSVLDERSAKKEAQDAANDDGAR